MSDIREGGCVCGAARYKIELSGHETGNCHCTDCRRQSGAPYLMFSTVPIDHFRWLKKPKGKFQASPLANRLFCEQCGTFLQWEEVGQPQRRDISTASLDDPTGLAPSYEIYTKSRMEGVSPVPGATQYEESDG